MKKTGAESETSGSSGTIGKWLCCTGGCGMVDNSNEDAAGIFKLHLMITV
jgi:hypothetical protein